MPQIRLHPSVCLISCVAVVSLTTFDEFLLLSNDFSVSGFGQDPGGGGGGGGTLI